MARRPPPGKCTYCLNFSDELTWDHVFPSAWFPDSTPQNIEKWKVPACVTCNAYHGKNEEELLVGLGLCIDPDNQANRGIVPRVLRAFDSSQARSEKDARARTAKKRAILSKVFRGRDIPLKAALPNFGLLPGQSLDEAAAVAVRATSVRGLIEKIVRGLTYLQDNRLIELPYRVQPIVAHSEAIADVIGMIERHGTRLECGPGISVVRAVAQDDPLSALYSIEIWERLTLYAAVDSEVDDSAI